MDRRKNRKKAAFRRKCIQLASALLYNANFAGFASGTIYKGDPKGVCVPGLNCYSCPGAVAACPLGSLQNALSAMPNKLPLYIVGILMLLGLSLGRLICGFLCPFGLIQELLHKIPGKKIKKARPQTASASWVTRCFVISCSSFWGNRPNTARREIPPGRKRITGRRWLRSPP